MVTHEQLSIKVSGSSASSSAEPNQGMEYGIDGAPDLCLRPVKSLNEPQIKGTSAAAPSASWRFLLSWSMVGNKLERHKRTAARGVPTALLCWLHRCGLAR